MKLAITAMGVVFPGGKGEGSLLDLLRSGASRIAPAASDPGKAVAEIGPGLKDLVRRKGLASLSRGALLAAAALTVAAPGKAWAKPETKEERKKSRYKETAHVKRFYQTNRY